MVRAAGAHLVGVADMEPFKAGETVLPPLALERFAKAVSVAVHLEDAIVDSIEQAPTPAYAQHYRVINSTLDRLTAQLVYWITARVFRRTPSRPLRLWMKATCWAVSPTKPWRAWPASAGKARASCL